MRRRELITLLGSAAAWALSGDGKRSVAAWPKLPRPSSTLPKCEWI